MATALPYIALAISAIGSGVAYHQQNEAEDAQKKAAKAQRLEAEQANQRAIRQSIAQSRLQQAALIASGQAQTGGTTSSAIQGGLGAAQTQLGANIGFANTQMAANSAINASLKKYNSSISNANTATMVGNLPSQFGWGPKESAQSIAESFGQKPNGNPPTPQKSTFNYQDWY